MTFLVILYLYFFWWYLNAWYLITRIELYTSLYHHGSLYVFPGLGRGVLGRGLGRGLAGLQPQPAASKEATPPASPGRPVSEPQAAKPVIPAMLGRGRGLAALG